MTTQAELSKLETLYQGQIYNQIALDPGFDHSKLEILYMGELFYAIRPGGSVEPPVEPTYDLTQMFAIF